MKAENIIPAQRGRFDGAGQILRYNWPQYVAGLVVALLGVGWWWCGRPGPEWLRMLGLVMALIALWWSVASVVASFWIYDVSPLYRWTWIPEVLGFVPRRWLNLHAGLDESSAVLRRMFPDSEGKMGDFFDAADMSEPSIQRARTECELDAAAERVNFRALPHPDHSFDNVFLLFAAHEIRNASSRELFFREVCRVLLPSGTILLVEHVRDFANFAAFGPGFFHFLPAREWRRLAHVAGLQVVGERRMTPFVKIILLTRKP
jgi:SAM-dependent methyltransferase